MASGIKEIRERMVQIIERADPDVDPKIKYREISDHIPIEQIPHTGKPNQTTRQFQITSQPVQTEGFLGGCTMDQPQRIRITLRYYVSGNPGDLSKVTDRAASDSARIEADLLLPPHEVSWDGTPLINVNIDGVVPLYASSIDNVWYMGLDYLVMYRLDQDTYGGEFAGNYVTLTALKAALVGRKTGTVARLINARTREVIGVWKVGSTKACLSVDFTKADGAEFADGVDIISQGAGSWSITYGTGIVVVDDAAEFFGYAETSNSDILGTGTHATYARGEVQTYTSQADIDLVTGTTDQIVSLVGSDGTLTNRQAWNGSVWVRQTRHGEVDAYANQAALAADSPSANGDVRRVTAGNPQQLDAGVWTEYSTGGGGLIAEHTVLSDLYASVGSAKDKAALKTTAGVLVGTWTHDGTRWRLDGSLDIAAASAEGAAMFAGLLTAVTGTVAWVAGALRISPAGGIALIYLQAMSSPATWYTKLRAYAAASTGVWATAYVSTRSHHIGMTWGAAGARTYISSAGCQNIGAGTGRPAAYYGPIAGVSSVVGGSVSVPTAQVEAYSRLGTRVASAAGSGGCQEPTTSAGTNDLLWGPANAVIGTVGNSAQDMFLLVEGPNGSAYDITALSLEVTP